MCSSEDQSFHKGTTYMIPKHNLGGDFIYPSIGSAIGWGVLPTRKSLVTGAYAYSGDSTGDREVWLQCVPSPNPNKSSSNIVLHTLSLSPLPRLVISGKVEALFRANTFRTSSQQFTIHVIAYDGL